MFTGRFNINHYCPIKNGKIRQNLLAFVTSLAGRMTWGVTSLFYRYLMPNGIIP